MKSNKTVCIDNEMIELLSNHDNASKLINELLIEYFRTGGDLEVDDLNKQIESNKLEISKLTSGIKAMEDKLILIIDKKKAFDEMFKDIPKEVLEDFRIFPKMTEDSLKSRFDNRYYIYDVKFEELVKAFKQYQKFKNGN